MMRLITVLVSFPFSAASFRSYFPFIPSRAASDCFLRSPSISKTIFPSAASIRARFTATVDFPSPAAVLVTRITLQPSSPVSLPIRRQSERMLSL